MYWMTLSADLDAEPEEVLLRLTFLISSYLLLLQNTDGWAAGRSILLWVWHAGENNIQWTSIAHAPK